MPYALNPRKGTLVVDEKLGKFQGGIAREIPASEVERFKHRKGIVLFDAIQQEKQQLRIPKQATGE